MKTVLVDGFKIRQTLDVEFPLMEVHSDDPTIYRPGYYIPKGERWVDHRFFDELPYLLKIERIFAPFSGEEYQKKRKELIDELGVKNRGVEFRHGVKEVEGVRVWSVDGKIVRETVDPDFIFGGHEYVYAYIPAGELWIDDRADPRERQFTLFHELVERRMMEKDKRSYDVAHGMAVEMEKEERRKKGAIYPGDVNYPGNLTPETVRQKCLI